MKYAWMIIALILGGIIAGSAVYTYSGCSAVNSKILQASYQSYIEGEHSTTPAGRMDNFNKALAGYKELEQKQQPVNGTGRLYFNLANTYYQLEQYPWAALYYYRAQNLMPRDDKVRQNLALTLGKLQQPLPKPPTIWQKLFLIGPTLSIPEALQLLALATLVCFFAASWMVWGHSRWLKALLFVTLCPLLFLAASLGYQRYFAPLNAVVVKATPIYRDAGTQYSQVQNEPLPGGMKLEILQLMPDGQWIKVALPDGTIGFVPIEALRLI